MNETMIGLVAALGVVVIEKLADFISARVSHREQKEDRKAEKHDEALEVIKKINEELKELSTKVQDNQARECRIRILRFEDEMRHDVSHSQDHFEQVMEDIDTYEEYCEKHPDFHNGIGRRAMVHIKEVYDECVREHKFL